MKTKSFLLSKTFWLNVIFFASAFFPQVKDFMKNNPETFASIWAAAAVILRFITSGKISLFNDDDDSSNKYNLPVWVLGVWAIGFLFAGLSLSSCSLPVTVGVESEKLGAFTWNPPSDPSGDWNVPTCEK